MTPATHEYLRSLWAVKCTTLRERYHLHLDRVKKLDLASTGVIGRDLLVRRRSLFVPKIYLAAFLATDSLTGHDGFLDFTDCMAILPPERFDALIENPDRLLEDDLAVEFAELGFAQALVDHFDVLARTEKGERLLEYLVFGGDRDDSPSPWPEMQAQATITNARLWLPRLFEQCGHLLKRE